MLIDVFKQSIADVQTEQGQVRLTLFSEMINDQMMTVEGQVSMQKELTTIASIVVASEEGALQSQVVS